MRFNCPKCGKGIDVDGDKIDEKITCPYCTASLRYSLEKVYPGRIIAGFELEEMLGVGGMGEVWLAYQQSMDRQVALKILSPYLSKDKSFVENFLDEVKLAAKLEHPNIVSAFDAGVEDGIYYLAMSYIPGETFAVRVGREKMLPEKEVMHIALHIARALEYAWKKFRIIHRDVNPANIMLTPDGGIKLMDMGISKKMDDDGGEAEENLLGTPNYISPEQIRGDVALDVRSDIYSLGATLYHLATGILPFESDDTYEILDRQLNERLSLANEVNPRISAECALLIDKMISKDRESRPESWQAVIDKFEAFSAGGTGVHDGVHKQVTISREHLKKVHDDHVMQAEGSGRKSALPLLFALLAMVALSAFLALRVLEKRKADPENKVDEKELNSEQSQEREPKSAGGAEEGSGGHPSIEKTRMDRIERVWSRAERLERKNPDKYLLIVREYAGLLGLTRGTVYEQQVQRKLDEYKNKHKIELVMRELEKRARNYVANRKYEEAAAVYREYNGSKAAETKDRRMKIAERFMDMVPEQPASVPDEEDEQNADQDDIDDFLGTVAADLCDADLAEVVMKCNAFEQRPIGDDAKEIAATIKGYVEDIRGSDQVAEEALMSGVVDSVVLISNGQQREVGIKVDGEQLLAEVKQGRGVAHFPFSIRQIPFEERYRILDGRIDSVPRELYIGIYYFNKHRFEDAEEHFQNSGVLTRHMVENIRNTVKNIAEKELSERVSMLLGSVGLIEDDEEIDWEAVSSDDRLLKLSENEAKTILSELRKIRSSQSGTEYMRRNGDDMEEFCKIIEETDFSGSQELLFEKGIGADAGVGNEIAAKVIRARSSRGIPLRCNPKGRGAGIIPELIGEKLSSNMILIIQSGDYGDRGIKISGKNNVTIKAEEDVKRCTIRIDNCGNVNIQGLRVNRIKIQKSQYALVDSSAREFTSFAADGVVHNCRFVSASCSGAVVFDHCLLGSIAARESNKILIRNSIVYGNVRKPYHSQLEYMPCFRWLRGHHAVIQLRNTLFYTEGAIGIINKRSYEFGKYEYWDKAAEDTKMYNLDKMKELLKLENSHMRDPMFLNPNKNDYRLKFKSPARRGSISGKNDIGPDPDLKPFPL